MKSRSVRRGRSKLRRRGRRDWHRGPIVTHTRRSDVGSSRFAIDFVIKAWAFASCKFVPVVGRCPMTMQDPINMYKRERHDTSASVNADLYDSEGRRRRSPPGALSMHHHSTVIGKWTMTNIRLVDFTIDKKGTSTGYCYQHIIETDDVALFNIFAYCQ